MRSVFVALFVALCAFTVSSSIHVQYGSTSEKDQLQKQKLIWHLFKHITQPSYYKDHQQIADTFHFWDHEEMYMKPEIVHKFEKFWKYGMLPKNEIFSVFYDTHLKQAMALFKLFYYAKDFDTFYKTAVWARNHINDGMFVYAFSVAVVHRPDTYYIPLPPIFEIYPYYFFPSEVIYKAQKYKQMWYGKYIAEEHSDFSGYTIYSNYSGHYLNLHPEQYMSYFMEDIGINSYYYYYNIYYPWWMNGDEFDLKYDHRGEQFYYMYQQLLARFYLERLSNGYGEIEWFNWDVPLETGYYPSLVYPNGMEFPGRPHYAKLSEYFYNYGQQWTGKSIYGYSHTKVLDYEKRIRDAIDLGYAYTKDGQKVDLFSYDGFNTLGNLIEGNYDSPYYKYYGPYQIYARHLLGYSFQPLDHYKVYPSALEHFETSLRDPVFYQFYKKIVTFFYKYKYYLPSYTENDLFYPGVTVDKVEFDRLVTYFDYDYSDLSNAVYVTPDEYEHDTFKIRVAQERLNHKPFTYKIYINSDKDTDAIVKVFLGPKFDEYGRYINMTENFVNFVQFDHFKYKLKSGQNVIVKNSKQIFNYMHDRTTYLEVYKKVIGNYEGTHEYDFDYEHYYGFPQRFLLPMGTYDGMAYQFYVFVAPYVPFKGQQKTDYPMVGSGLQFLDGYPLGYPFDRKVEFEKLFYHVPNGYFHEVKIYHRDYDHEFTKHVTL